MKSRASRAVPIYIFSASSFLRAKWHKFCFLCAPLKSRRREKCFDLGTNRHRESLWCESFRRSPLATLQRVFLARVPFIVLYILSLPSPCCQFSSPLIFRPFSAPPLLRAAPRSPFASLAQPSLPSPYSPPSPIRLIRVQRNFLSDSCANSPLKLSPVLYKPHAKPSAIPPQKQKNADFLNFFESKSCSVQKVAVLLHSLTEKTGMPVSSERQQKFFEKIP